MGFYDNITDPRNLSNYSNYSNYSNDSKIIYVMKENEWDLGEISVFISAVLLSLGGFIAIVASNIRRSRCVSINCGCTRCTRKISNDPDIGV